MKDENLTLAVDALGERLAAGEAWTQAVEAVAEAYDVSPSRLARGYDMMVTYCIKRAAKQRAGK